MEHLKNMKGKGNRLPHLLCPRLNIVKKKKKAYYYYVYIRIHERECKYFRDLQNT
jgi:hypothetical protein